MIVEKLLFNGTVQSYGLKAVSERRLGLKEQELTLFSETNIDNIEEEEEDDLDIFGFKKEFIDKSIRTQFVEWGFKPFTLDQIEYGARDITLPYRIYLLQLEGRIINEEQWFPYYGVELENDTTFVLAEMTYKGVPIDSEEWINTEKDNRIVYNERLKALNSYIEINEPKFCYHADLFNPLPSSKIQWSSPQQVIALYRSWNMCPKEKSKETGKLEWSVGAKALLKDLSNNSKEAFLKDGFPEIIDTKEVFTLAYLLFKKSEQLITTFGKDWLKYIHPITKRGHPNYNQLMISTRLSSNNFNAQNLPRTENFRKCINSKLGILVCNDYSAQEVYSASYVHDSKPLLKFFEEGDPIYGTDIHSFMAAKTYSIVYGMDFYCDKKSAERQNQKIISFQTIYGGSEYALSSSIGVEVDVAKSIQDGFIKGFNLEEPFKYYKKEAMDSGYIVLDEKTNKRYFYPYMKEMKEAQEKALSYYPKNWKDYSKENKETWKAEQKITNPDLSYQWKIYMTHKGKLERRSLNLRVQGLCASMTKRAALSFSNYVWDNKLNNEVYLILSCHDELLIEIIGDEVKNKEVHGLKLQEYMEEASAYFLNGLVSTAEPLYSTFWTK
jgi:DNA polymerase I-like protein with 3'-5' exonuclease and polymerase domains